MADDSQRIKYVFVDSTNRDTSLYPTGNTYILHLTNPVHSVIQVDLVAAKVPNTMYNLTNGSNVLVYSDTTNTLTSNVSVSPGYYSAWGLATALENAAGMVFTTSFIESEGKFIFATGNTFTICATTTEIANMLGITRGTTYSSFPASSSLVYANDPVFSTSNLFKTNVIADLSTNEYVFLDIEELRTTSVLDAKKLIQGTTEGSSIRSTFGMIPLDVAAGVIKNYKETTDYKQYITYNTPIPKISRLTVRWVDRSGALLNFQGFDHNAFTLRIHCEYREPPPPTPPLQDIQIQRIVDALQHAPPPPKPPPEKRFLGRWVVIVIVLVIAASWLAYMRLVKPFIERLNAIPQPPQHVPPKISLY